MAVGGQLVRQGGAGHHVAQVREHAKTAVGGPGQGRKRASRGVWMPQRTELDMRARAHSLLQWKLQWRPAASGAKHSAAQATLLRAACNQEQATRKGIAGFVAEAYTAGNTMHGQAEALQHSKLPRACVVPDPPARAEVQRVAVALHEHVPQPGGRVQREQAVRQAHKLPAGHEQRVVGRQRVHRNLEPHGHAPVRAAGAVLPISMILLLLLLALPPRLSGIPASLVRHLSGLDGLHGGGGRRSGGPTCSSTARTGAARPLLVAGQSGASVGVPGRIAA